MVAVRGVLLDESLLCAEDNDGNTHFLPGAEALLRRLQYSKLHTGISYGEGASSQKVAFLARVATAYSFDSIVLNASCIDDTFNRMLVAWSGIGETCVYVTSKKDEGLFLRLKQGWKIIVKMCFHQVVVDIAPNLYVSLSGSSSTFHAATNTSVLGGEDVARENTGVLFINKLEELPITLCRFSKMAVRDTSVVTVGYVMKPSREEDFSKRGAFPMYPTQNGLMFVPLTFDLPLASQIQEVDLILHKATDEIVSVDPGSFLDFSKGISFSKGMQELERYIEDRPDCCVIDPLNSIYPLLDRLRIHHILLGLEDLNTKSGCRIRAPHFLKVDYFHEQNLAERLSEAQLYFPNIVKPQVACGVADAHSMAIVFRTEDFKDLRVPLPAIVQEYIDHSSLLFKFYVLGEKVFHAVKKSMPNADVLLSSSEKNGFQPIIFDSLKSLPTDNNKGQHSGNTNKQSIDVDLVTDAANWLRGRLGLTIFGFDVVVQEGSRDHVIVDVNYLPSFKEIPDNIVIPAFWDAIKSSYELRKEKYE